MGGWSPHVFCLVIFVFYGEIYGIPRELSGGELRRLTIARALMNYPKVILADEPTSDLDVENTKEVLETLKEINKKNNTTIILVTHDLACLDYADKVYTMSSGKIYEGKNI